MYAFHESFHEGIYTMDFYQSHRRPLVFLIALVISSMTLLAALPAAAQGRIGHTFPPATGTTWGTAQTVGNGQIQTFVTVDSARSPRLVGVYFTEGALSGLPETMSDGRWDVKDANGSVIIPCCGHEFVLDFPASSSVTPFKAFVLNWNPMGHAPSGIYDRPHFDLHFYTIPDSARTAIAAATAETMCSVPNPPEVGGVHPVTVSCETFEIAMFPLSTAHTPPGYISAGAVEPGMGNHLINSRAPELAGPPDPRTWRNLGINVPRDFRAKAAEFTHTWIYGANAGRLTFLEPMITLAFLQEQHEKTCTDIAVPEAAAEAGYYPTQYCIRYIAGENGSDGAYVVSLESFFKLGYSFYLSP